MTRIAPELYEKLAFIDALRERGVAYCKVDGLEVNLFPSETFAPPLDEVDVAPPEKKDPNPLAREVDGWRGFAAKELFGDGR